MAEFHNVETLIEQSNSSWKNIEHCLQHGKHHTQCVEKLASRILEIVRGMSNGIR